MANHDSCCPVHGCKYVDSDCPAKNSKWWNPCDWCRGMGLTTPEDLHQYRFPTHGLCPECKQEIRT